MRKTWLLAFAGLALTAACQKDDPLSPQSDARLQGANLTDGAQKVSVMSRNIYIGFDADAAIAALSTGDPSVYVPVVQSALGQLIRTDFAARAGAFADEIAHARPHAVGVQEAYRIQGDFTPLGGPVLNEDHLVMLQAAIAARHLPYALVDTVMDTDAEPLPGVHIVDHEALFVDTSRVTVRPGVIAKQYEVNVGPIAPGVDKKTGFIAAPVTIGGMQLTIVTTHLESDLGPGTYDLIAQIRGAQAMEIATAIGSAPAIVMGDMNDHAGSLMYQVFSGAQLSDVWQALRPGVTGNSDSCFQPDLSDALAHCQERIDFVFARGLAQPRAGLLGSAGLVGITPNERITLPNNGGYLWPSDHAGLVAELLVPPANGVN